MGIVTWLKKGGPTVICSSVKASETSGKTVPQNTAKSIPKRIQLLSKKAVSREAKDSKRFSALSKGSRSHKSPKEKISVRTRNVPKKGPILDWAKA